MADYKAYLAFAVLTEDKIVTHRLLSRALKVHVNTAKEMLYEFHRHQNTKKSGSVHATYLLSGTKRKEESIPAIAEVKKDGEDDYMQSSPFMASSMPQFEEEGTGERSVLSITLVKEEKLEEARSQYEHINSIHIYSIGPSPIKDLQILSDITREVQVLVKSEDPFEHASTYGTTTNPNVRRRTNRRPPPPIVAAPILAKSLSATKAKPEVKEPAKPASKPDTKSQSSTAAKDFFGKGKEKPASKAAATKNSAQSSKESTPVPAPVPAALKRESSSLFKSFAKAKPKLQRGDTDSSAAVSVAEDSPMRDVEDDDDEEDTYVAPPPKVKTKVSGKDGEEGEDRKSRKAREAALKAMMDTDDEDEPVVKFKKPTKTKEVEKPDVEMIEDDDPVEVEAVKEERAPAAAASSGRRRGRRRVMKKKMVKDEDGYLVTKEEAAWESFSEDEPVSPVVPKLKSQTSSSAAAVKPKKGAAKAGQGNIMSFFGKK